MTRPAEGSVITAQFQSEGRGQRGTVWSSERGANLLMSLILYPTWLKMQNQFDLSQCIAVGLAEAIEEILQAVVKIKWPNDLLINDRKLAGTLIELQSDSKGLLSAVIGIGLNVNQTEFHGLSATSLMQQTGERMEPIQIAKICQQAILKRYDELKAGESQKLKSTYFSKLYRYDIDAYYRLRGEEIKARITGVDERGCIELHSESGILKADIKELEYL
jgi:BirA family biotin operon repressor/biotin-[acetyl-CoA-carboxylase] ligase